MKIKRKRVRVYCRHNRRASASNNVEKTPDGRAVYTISTRARTPLLKFCLNDDCHVTTTPGWETNHVEYGVNFYGRRGGPFEEYPFLGTIYLQDMQILTGQFPAQWNPCACGQDCLRPRSAPRSRWNVRKLEHLRSRIAKVAGFLYDAAQWILR